MLDAALPCLDVVGFLCAFSILTAVIKLGTVVVVPFVKKKVQSTLRQVYTRTYTTPLRIRVT